MAGPGRQPTSRDAIHALDGTPVWLGALVSSGSAVNNSTTATAFATGMPGANLTTNFLNTLSGKTLLIQATGPGWFLPSPTAALSVVSPVTQPPLPNTTPGVGMQEGERIKVQMLPGTCFLQWLPLVSANLLVWELQ